MNNREQVKVYRTWYDVIAENATACSELAWEALCAEYPACESFDNDREVIEATAQVADAHNLTRQLEAYAGAYSCLLDWAQQYIEDTGQLNTTPSLRAYEDCCLSGDITVAEHKGRVHVYYEV